MQYLTPGGLKKIKDELQDRKTAKRQEIAKRLEEAKSLGDLSENAEYSAAKEAQAFNESKILELEELIKESVVVEKEDGKEGVVNIGSTVECQADKSSDKRTFTIVSPQEAQPTEGLISNESPLGKAFLGHKKGDIVEAETPRGKLKFKITKIS